MFDGSSEDVLFEDIQALVADKVAESRQLEFKRDQIGTGSEAKREFIKDVSAFANTIGGTLVIGVDADKGIASACKGVELEDVDAELLRLDSILRTGVEPRIPSVEIDWVERDENSGFILVQVARSRLAPHRVIFRDHAKFYARTGAGIYAMNVDELRSAFLANESLPQQMRRFRDERLSLINGDEAPVRLAEGIRFILHIMPESALARRVDVQPSKKNSLLPAMGAYSIEARHTIDGYLTFPAGCEREGRPVPSYALVFHEGIIESVLVKEDYGDQSIVPAEIETEIKGEVERRLQHFERLGISDPYFVFLSIEHAKGWRFHRERHYLPNPAQNQDRLIFPDIRIDDHHDLGQSLRPLFNRFWNAFGFDKSWNYDDEGNWQARRL